MKYLRTCCLIACGAMPLFGTPVPTVFTFDDGSLANGSSNSSIQSYMNSKLGAGAVTVTGAMASNSYNGDGHVIGPGTGSTSLTLGTSDGSTQHLSMKDLFITNIANTSTEIKMQFNNGLKIYSVSFDYEIFPDGTCATGYNCGSNWPDFTFDANGNVVLHTLGVKPATGSHSPASGSTHTEKAPQFIGTTSTYYFPAGVSLLEFMDWPATIGIDNLVLDFTPPGGGGEQSAPEPVSLLLTGTGLLGIYFIRRRRPSPPVERN